MKASPQSLPGFWWFPVVSGRPGMCPAGCVASSCTKTPRSMTRQMSILLVYHWVSTLISPWDLMQVTIPRWLEDQGQGSCLLSFFQGHHKTAVCLPCLPRFHTLALLRELPGENVKHLTLVPCFHVEAWHLRNVGRRRADFCGGRLKRNYKVSTFFAPWYPSFQATPTAPTPAKHLLSTRFPIYEQKASVLSATLRELYIMMAHICPGGILG